jgi:hypothetical protein
MVHKEVWPMAAWVLIRRIVEKIFQRFSAQSRTLLPSISTVVFE